MRAQLTVLQLGPQGSPPLSSVSDEPTALVFCRCPPGLEGAVGLLGVEQGPGLHVVGWGDICAGSGLAPTVPDGAQALGGAVRGSRTRQGHRATRREGTWVGAGLPAAGPRVPLTV